MHCSGPVCCRSGRWPGCIGALVVIIAGPLDGCGRGGGCTCDVAVPAAQAGGAVQHANKKQHRWCWRLWAVALASQCCAHRAPRPHNGSDCTQTPRVTGYCSVPPGAHLLVVVPLLAVTLWPSHTVCVHVCVHVCVCEGRGDGRQQQAGCFTQLVDTRGPWWLPAAPARRLKNMSRWHPHTPTHTCVYDLSTRLQRSPRRRGTSCTCGSSRRHHHTV